MTETIYFMEYNGKIPQGAKVIIPLGTMNNRTICVWDIPNILDESQGVKRCFVKGISYLLGVKK